MAQKTIDLLNGLNDFVLLQASIRAEVIASRSDIVFSGTVSLKYDFVKLIIAIKNEPDSRPWLECSFRIEDEVVSISDFYCDDPEELKWKEYVLKEYPLLWRPGGDTELFNTSVVRYLEIADVIAKEGYLCSSGDNYRPGYYSEIGWNDEQILLWQTNWHNAKSIDHKKDYHMRELQFRIPIIELPLKKSFEEDFSIGEMLVQFSDRSSANNRACGTRIVGKMSDEKAKFHF